MNHQSPHWLIVRQTADSVLRVALYPAHLQLQCLSKEACDIFSVELSRVEALDLASAIQAHWDWGEYSGEETTAVHAGTVWEYAKSQEEARVGHLLSKQAIHDLAKWLVDEGVPGYLPYRQHARRLAVLAGVRGWGRTPEEKVNA